VTRQIGRDPQMDGLEATQKEKLKVILKAVLGLQVRILCRQMKKLEKTPLKARLKRNQTFKIVWRRYSKLIKFNERNLSHL
jgi:hypothetical protein